MDPRTAGLAAAATGGLLGLWWLTRDKKKSQGGGASNPCDSAGEWVTGADLARLIESGDPCVFQRTWSVHLRTFEELHYFGQLISGQMLFRVESERPGNKVDLVALEKVEAWIKGCRWSLFDPTWAQLQDNLEAHEIALEYYSSAYSANAQSDHATSPICIQLSLSQVEQIQRQTLANRNALRDEIARRYPAGSMPMFERFQQVLKDYGSLDPPRIFGGRGMTTGPMELFGYAPSDKSGLWIAQYPALQSAMYPHLDFANHRWQIRLPQERYEQILYAWHRSQWIDRYKEEIWRDADPNGWQGGWLRRPDDHPYYACSLAVRQANRALPPTWSKPDTEAARDLNRILMPRLFALYGETAVFEYASAHFLQTLYLSSLNLNAAKEGADAALNTAGKAIALAGAAIVAASGGWAAIAGAAVAAFGLIVSIFEWGLQGPANIAREKAAREVAGDRLVAQLTRFGLSVDAFFGNKVSIVWSNPSNSLDANDKNAQANRAWDYFRARWSTRWKSNDIGGPPQIPLLLLRPDFDFASYTRYEPTGAAIIGVRVARDLRDQGQIDAVFKRLPIWDAKGLQRENMPQAGYDILAFDLDLKGMHTPKPWGAKA